MLKCSYVIRDLVANNNNSIAEWIFYLPKKSNQPRKERRSWRRISKNSEPIEAASSQVVFAAQLKYQPILSGSPTSGLFPVPDNDEYN